MFSATLNMLTCMIARSEPRDREVNSPSASIPATWIIPDSRIPAWPTTSASASRPASVARSQDAVRTEIPYACRSPPARVSSASSDRSVRNSRNPRRAQAAQKALPRPPVAPVIKNHPSMIVLLVLSGVAEPAQRVPERLESYMDGECDRRGHAEKQEHHQ